MLKIKGNSMEIVGIVKNVRPLITKRGTAMAFAVLENHKDEIDLVFFPGIWEKCKNYIEDRKEVTLRGKIEYDHIQPRFVVEDCSRQTKIMILLEKGYSVDEISKSLSIGIAEIELIKELRSIKITEEQMAGTPNYPRLHEIEDEFSRKYGTCFVHDGIICDGHDDEDDYFEKLDPGTRILWILKESNKEENIGKNPKGWYLREYLWEIAVGKEPGKQWKKSYLLVAKISYAIINGISTFGAIPDDESIKSIFKEIAAINVKKTNGCSKADDSEIALYYRNDKQLILDQIGAIQSEIIINCSGVKELFNDLTNGMPKEIDEFRVQRSNDILLIDAYQPNQRRITHEQYFNLIMKCLDT
jgi:hypothetical protein